MSPLKRDSRIFCPKSSIRFAGFIFSLQPAAAVNGCTTGRHVLVGSGPGIVGSAGWLLAYESSADSKFADSTGRRASRSVQYVVIFVVLFRSTFGLGRF